MGQKGFTEIIFTEAFTGDTTWTVDNFDLELDVDWIEFMPEGYSLFGGTFTASFANFNYHVDSIIMDVANYCPDCFDIILYKAGEDPIYFEAPLGEFSIQTIVNPWPDNPDSLILWTYEGGIKVETIYHNAPIGQRETEISGQTYLSPNPAVGFIRIKQGSTICIYNSVGELMMDSYCNSLDKRIDISSFNNGVYFLTIIDETKIQTLKFIKAGN